MPPRYTIEVQQTAEKVLRRLPRDLKERITAAIFGLETNPRPPGALPHKGQYSTWRIRVGDWRVIYTIEDERLIVLVVKIGPRGDVYRNLGG